MNRIRRTCRSVARLTGPPGTAEPRANLLTGRDGFAGRFIHDVAAAASVAVGHQFGRPGHRARPRGGRWAARLPSPGPRAGSAGQTRPATTAPRPRLRAVAAPGLLPHTVRLCVHCQQRPAGFWISSHGGQTVRRPWCLSCCQQLDPVRCDVIAFDGQQQARRSR
jgi:hypothetical protein